MKDAIKAALLKLDAGNDEHWTQDGSPKIAAIVAIVGDDTITRKQVIDAAPDFNRAKAVEAATASPAEAEATADDAIVIIDGEPAPEVFNLEDDHEVEEEAEAKAKVEVVTAPAPVEKVPPQLKAINEEYLLLNSEIETLIAQKNALNDIITAKAQRVSQLEPFLSKYHERSQQEDQDERMNYIRNQFEVRRQKAEQRMAAMEALGYTAPPAVKAPLDQAMASRGRTHRR
jgi:hypothetical protein